METVELTEEAVIKPKKWRKTRMLFRLVKYISFVVAVVWASLYVHAGAMFVKDEFNSRWAVLKLKVINDYGLVKYSVKTVDYNESEIEELKATYSAKYHLKPIVANAMIDQEAPGVPYLSRNFRFRFEQSWKDQFSKKFPRTAFYNDEEYKLVFSSIGLMQVSYVIWKDFCELKDVNDLFNPATNMDCGLRVMSRCLEDNAGNFKRNSELLRFCFRKYNGSGPKAEEYASVMMQRITDQVVDREQILENLPSRNTPTVSAESSEIILEPIKVKEKATPTPTPKVEARGTKIACEYKEGCYVSLDKDGKYLLERASAETTKRKRS